LFRSPFPPLVEGGSAAGHQSCGEQGVNHQGVINSFAAPQVKSNQRGQQDQSGEPDFDQLTKNRQPGFFDDGGRAKNLSGCFHVQAFSPFTDRATAKAGSELAETLSSAGWALASSGSATSSKERRLTSISIAPIIRLKAPTAT